MLEWILNNHVGEISSIIGVFIALIGFTITILNVVKSRKAADRAESAATQALEGVRYIDTVQNMSRAISILEEIRRLNRVEEWKVLLDRHSNFRNFLIEIRSGEINLEEEQKKIIQTAITHSTTISNKIEVALGKNETPTGPAQMNNILSKQIDDLGAVLVEIRLKRER